VYTKLYNTIVMSSIWSEDNQTRILWITMLATADPEGFIFGSPIGLATLSRLSLDEVNASLQKLASPDPNSSDLLRAPGNEGRRIELVEGGWRILNFIFYRQLQRSEDRRRKHAEAQKRYREKSANKTNDHSDPALSKMTHAESESESESELESENTNTPPVLTHGPQGGRVRVLVAKRFVKPTLEEVKLFIEEGRYRVDAEAWYAHYEANGWRVGKNRMVRWKAAVHTWQRRREAEEDGL
jgi:hypothetical protein